MKRSFWYIVGILLLTVGLVWIVFVTGAVGSRSEGFTSFGSLWGALLFHAVFMAVGAALVGKALSARHARGLRVN